MEFFELNDFSFFGIGNECFYPKMKFDNGYIDLKTQEIKTNVEIVYPITVISSAQVQQSLNLTDKEFQDYKKQLLVMFMYFGQDADDMFNSFLPKELFEPFGLNQKYSNN